jgi:hypothetical protein
VLEAVFILLEFPSPSRRIFIGSHSLPPSLVRRIGPSELPAIKVNNDKIKVITTVSKPETDLSMKLTDISDKFERAFSNQHSQVARIIARLEKVEGQSSSLNFPNDSIPQ